MNNQRQDPKTWYKDFKGLTLTEQTQKMLQPTQEFSKSGAIQHLDRIQDKVIQDAKKTGDVGKMKEAQAFASRLNKEQNFLRHSK